MASTSGPFTSLMTSRNSRSETCAYCTGLEPFSPLSLTMSKPQSVKNRRTCVSPAGM
jgi:hypothetical protein